MRKALVALPAFLILAALGQAPALGQDAKLIEAAKKEGGRVTAYGSLESEIVDAIKKAFRQKTGLELDYWRASATKVMDRAVSEFRAGRVPYDVIITNRNPMNLMQEQGLFVKYDSPSFKAFPKEVMDDFFGPAYRYNVFGVLYNTRLVKPAEAPKSLEDLLKPQYRGKFVMPDPTQHTTTTQWLANLHKVMGKEKADKFIRDLAATKPLMVESLLPAARRATTGETPIALSYVKYVYIFQRREGAPLDYVRLPRMLGEGHFVGLASKSPRPNAGKAFIDFFLSPDGMKILAQEGEFVALKGYAPPLPDADKWNVIMVDELDEKEFRQKRDEYRRIFFGS
jgi:iron(III) transport system substrate-binding protein